MTARIVVQIIEPGEVLSVEAPGLSLEGVEQVLMRALLLVQRQVMVQVVTAALQGPRIQLASQVPSDGRDGGGR